MYVLCHPLYSTLTFGPPARLPHRCCYHSKGAIANHRHGYVGCSLRPAGHHFPPQERVHAHWLDGALPYCVRP